MTQLGFNPALHFATHQMMYNNHYGNSGPWTMTDTIILTSILVTFTIVSSICLLASRIRKGKVSIFDLLFSDDNGLDFTFSVVHIFTISCYACSIIGFGCYGIYCLITNFLL